MTHISTRMGQFRPSPTGAMSALVRTLKAQGRDIIGLVGGEPDFATPDPIKQAGIAAINANQTRYTDADGTLALRTALSAKFKRENGLDYPPDQIVASSGTKPILHAALLAMTDPGRRGDRAGTVLGLPSRHRTHRRRGAGARCPAPRRHGFRLSARADLEAAITPRTRVLILNSPNNPTGTRSTSEDELRATDRGAQAPSRHLGADRRDLRAHPVRGLHVAPSIAALDPEIVRADGDGERLLQGLRDDGLAASASPAVRRSR